jgi:hypothetical protein
MTNPSSPDVFKGVSRTFFSADILTSRHLRFPQTDDACRHAGNRFEVRDVLRENRSGADNGFTPTVTPGRMMEYKPISAPAQIRTVREKLPIRAT